MPISLPHNGSYSPVKSLGINEGSSFKNVYTAWVNHNGVFKQVFPDPTPTDASLSGLYDTDKSVGSLISAEGIWYSRVTNSYDAKFPQIPLKGAPVGSIASSKVTISDANGDPVSFYTKAVYADSSYTLSGLTTEGVDILENFTSSSTGLSYILTATRQYPDYKGIYLYTKDFPSGSQIRMRWEWTTGGKTYFYNLPLVTL